jgi:Ethylbenzene dehydrogenase
MAMKRKSSGFKTAAAGAGIALAFAILASTTYFSGIPVGAALAPSILAPTVTGSINTANPGTEAFWSQLTPLAVPLTATDDYGGSIQTASVKIASNGTHLLMEVTYSDPTMSNGRAGTAPTADQTLYPGLFFANATVHGFDQFGVWWSMSQTPGPPPCMKVGTNQHGGTSAAALAGTGNVWRWTASSTDSNGTSFKTAKYGAGTGPLATHLINYTHSFANDMLLNNTGFYLLGQGSSNVNSTVLYGPNHAAYSPYIVFDKGVYDYTAHTWTQVIARPMTTTPSAAIAQFAPGTVYNFALAAFDGGAHPIPAGVPAPAGWTSMADDQMTKSISTWVTVQFTGLAPGATTLTTITAPASTVTQTTTATSLSTTTTTSTVTGAPSTSTVVSTVTAENSSNTSFQTATVASLAAMLIGLIAGMVAVGRFQGRKSS